MFLITFSFIVDGNVNPMDIGLFNPSERALSQGYAQSKVTPLSTTDSRGSISATKFSSDSIGVAQIEPSQFRGQMSMAVPMATESSGGSQDEIGDFQDENSTKERAPVFFAYAANFD